MPTPKIPAMGTPEFREFVTTPAWVELRHDLALAEDRARTVTAKNEAATELIHATFPTIILGGRYGATDPGIWSADWRQRLAPDHPARMDYEESIHGKSPAGLQEERLRSMASLHEAALRVAV